MRPKLTVIFDRSAFHGERCDALRRSRLTQLTRNGSVLVHHSPALMEETISMYEKPANRDELRAQLPFILGICNGRWFVAPGEIWHRELVQNRGPDANVFMKDRVRRDVEERMRKGILGTGSWTEFLEGLPLKDAERQKQRKQRELLVEMRKEIAGARKAPDFPKHGKPPSDKDFDALRRRVLDGWGKDIIEKQICHRDPLLLYQMWSRNKLRYPFFTSFLEGSLYAAFQASVEHSKKIDPNFQVDVQLLCCLHRADVVVSCDDRFLKDAFQLFWQPRGKRLFSTEDFVRWLAHI